MTDSISEYGNQYSTDVYHPIAIKLNPIWEPEYAKTGLIRNVDSRYAANSWLSIHILVALGLVFGLGLVGMILSIPTLIHGYSGQRGFTMWYPFIGTIVWKPSRKKWRDYDIRRKWTFNRHEMFHVRQIEEDKWGYVPSYLTFWRGQMEIPPFGRANIPSYIVFGVKPVGVTYYSGLFNHYAKLIKKQYWLVFTSVEFIERRLRDEFRAEYGTEVYNRLLGGYYDTIFPKDGELPIVP